MVVHWNGLPRGLGQREQTFKNSPIGIADYLPPFLEHIRPIDRRPHSLKQFGDNFEQTIWHVGNNDHAAQRKQPPSQVVMVPKARQ